jgi:hypothetical protein
MDRGLLRKLKGRTTRFRVSMYVDDAAIFLRPSAADVTNLKAILLNFGAINGLQTNLQKTSVTPISCNDIYLDSILANFPVSRATFPIKYLGLPLNPEKSQEARLPTLVRQSGGEFVFVEWQEPDAGQTSLSHQVDALVSTGLPTDGPQTTFGGYA